MPTTTSNQGIPLPVDADDPNIPDDLNTMALHMERRLLNIFTTEADRNTRVPAPIEGQFAFTKDTNTFWVHDGTTWQKLYVSYTYVPQITSGTAAPSGGNNGDVYFKV